MAFLQTDVTGGKAALVPILEINRLIKTFNHQPVLDQLSLGIYPGEVYGLLGPNGAGKTTTINILCGLLNADRGKIKLNGQAISASSKALLGIAPQENLLYKTLTCVENLHFFASIYGLRGQERTKQIQTCLAAVGLIDRANSAAETLSGGMKRRLSIAIALVHNPKLVILDEPTTGLDIEARYEIWQLIRNLKQQNITVLLTTHLLDEAERLCDRIGILKGGKLLAEGSLAQLRQKVPAAEILLVQTDQPEQTIAHAQKLGFTYRKYDNELAFWLPKPLPLAEIVNLFATVPLNSISKQPVRLEHIYVEVTQQSQDAH
ncbi:Fe(3+)-transporting ATPase [Thalassoporum mexicanum PCC 7367]|uniref:ABC transporter ATP-binding protein n=1 Tax=Thalassoporum mexicanum TaxID=3457544 RepID=UPI00029FD097|nr:ABC transporter ATP-binding protein [Pseudanabaena sp. PCC 7367]AFY71668.1 Fe(3+)-transporting ATPase [Pseudanabaena sp. PCC 7367]